jgi:enoyl-CoA hydratase/carnithine racemase
MQLDEVTYETADGVGEIVLNRPERLNPISARPGGTRDQLVWAIEQAEADDAVGCLVLRGAGRAFSGGGDLTGNVRREHPIDDFRFVEDADRFHDRVRASRVPVIAAVHGHCLGAALSLVSSCDFVIAAESARFGYPEGRLGLIGASAVVPILGRQWAKFLMLTGEILTARQARDAGLALTVEPDDTLLDRVRELARRIARMPRDGVFLNRRAIDAVADAAGDAAGRLAAITADTVTASMAARATAPDGRTFRSILDTEGMAGLKAAREAQYREPWLAP